MTQMQSLGLLGAAVACASVQPLAGASAVD